MNGKAAQQKRLVIWHISDQRRGHDNQGLGLIQALKKLRDCEDYKLQAIPAARLILPLISGNFAKAYNLPQPRLIIAAGRRTHLSMLCAGRSTGAKTAVIMNPDLPYSWFDLCLIPAHDNPPARNNIITTEGPLNRINPSFEHDEGRGLILIGGKSRHFIWDQAGLLSQVDRLTDAPGIQWLISDSPRTPASTSDALRNLQKDNVCYLSHQDTGGDWLPARLAESGEVWISEDSMSMIYEALTSGARIGLFDLPVRQGGRLARVKKGLASRNFITTFEQWSQGKSLTPPPEILNESDRCARLLLERLAL